MLLRTGSMEMELRQGMTVAGSGREQVLVRMQSENDLFYSAAMSAAATPSPSPSPSASLSSSRKPRGMQLRRHSSLPVSSLDSLLDEFQTRDPVAEDEPVQLASASIEEEVEEPDEKRAGSSTDAGRGGCSSSASSSSSDRGMNRDSRGSDRREYDELYAMSIAGGFGIGIGIGIGGYGGGFGLRRSMTGGNRGPGSGVDAYYRKLLADDPGNSLLLRNYARYLHEQRDFRRAEEFYERAILASPEDPEIRAQYAKVIWEFRGDEERAADYFEQAARAAPDDCSVMGAYAAFMWDVDENADQKMVVSSAIASAA